MKITVTKADISSATRDCPERNCPVAKALSRMGFVVDVCTHHIKFASGNESIMPQKAIDWIDQYDHRKTIKPFSFNLDYTPE